MTHSTDCTCDACRHTHDVTETLYARRGVHLNLSRVIRAAMRELERNGVHVHDFIDDESFNDTISDCITSIVSHVQDMHCDYPTYDAHVSAYHTRQFIDALDFDA